MQIASMCFISDYFISISNIKQISLLRAFKITSLEVSSIFLIAYYYCYFDNFSDRCITLESR